MSAYMASANPPRDVRLMQVVFGLLAIQFFIPSFGYLLMPDLAMSQADQIGRLLGGGPYPIADERGIIFRVLAAGNVFTLGFLCTMMAVDIKRYRALIPAFVVLKGYSAIGYLFTYFVYLRHPLFPAIFFWDGLAAVLVVYFGRRALRALNQPTS